MERAPALIIGGGPAGAAAAIGLGRAGRPSLLVDRSAGPRDVVCGGFLGWDALRALEQLDVDPFALGARPVRRVRLVAGRRTVEAQLPSVAAGLSRRTLDAALLARAQAAGADIRRGVRVVSLDPESRTARLHDGAELAADSVILATGKHDLRGALRPTPRTPHAVGLRAALLSASATALDEVIELHLFGGGYAGLLLQEEGRVNFCMSLTGRRLAQAGGAALLIERIASENPLLAERLGALPRDFDSIARVPYGWRARAGSAGVFRVGDQGSVIASLAGDGVAIALTSGLVVASSVAAHGPAAASAFQRNWARRAAAPLRAAGLLRLMAEGPMRGPAMRVLSAAPSLAALASRLTRIS